MNAVRAKAAPSTSVFAQEFAVRQGQSPATSIFAFPRHRNAARVTTHRSEWVEELRPKLNELTSLRIGWDGYKGLPVSFDCASFGADLLEKLCQVSVPAPSLVPGSDGTMQIEWHVGGFDIELDIKDVYEVVAYRRSCATSAEEELHLDTDFTQVFSWLVELSENGRSATRLSQD